MANNGLIYSKEGIWQPPVRKKMLFGLGTLPQAFFCEKLLFGPGTLPQASFFFEKNVFWVLVRCRRRLFFLKKYVFGIGTLPQAPFFAEKMLFWSWNVAAGAFF